MIPRSRSTEFNRVCAMDDGTDSRVKSVSPIGVYGTILTLIGIPFK